jgi:hypothetical protein
MRPRLAVRSRSDKPGAGPGSGAVCTATELMSKSLIMQQCQSHEFGYLAVVQGNRISETGALFVRLDLPN